MYISFSRLLKLAINVIRCEIENRFNYAIGEHELIGSRKTFCKFNSSLFCSESVKILEKCQNT